MIQTRNVPYLNGREKAAFMASLDSDKYKFLAYLMCDCGLRVSEAVSLRIRDFNFQKQIIYVKALKKRGKELITERIMSNRIIQIAAAYYPTVKSKHPDDFMFPAINESESGYLCRKQVWLYFKKNGGVNPHKLRHTFVTDLVDQGTPIHVVREMVGHSDIRVTQMYVHASEQRKREAAAKLEGKNMFTRFKEKLFPQKQIDVSMLPMSVGAKVHIGRKKELLEVATLAEKKVNTLLIGDRGVGKSHILDNYQSDKVLRIDDFSEFKKTLANLLLHLSRGEKGEVMSLLNLNIEVITKASAKRIVEVLTQITEKHEFTIIVDDASRITPSVIAPLEMLAKHFHMIVAARSIPISQASWLSNFQKVEVGVLNRVESRELIRLTSEDFADKIEDREMFTNHIYENTAGNPLAIVEMCQRYSVEKFIRIEDIAAITHTSARKGRSFVPFMLILLGCVVVGKFYAKEAMEADKEAFMIFGAAAMVVLMFGRLGINSIKRKFV